MKIQNLAIIFLVITIPLIVILSYYLNLQQKTLKLQAEYDTKLAESTKEGIKAFEVNTVDWSEWVSEVSSKKIRDNVQATVNTFLTSLANNLNISGTAKEYMLNYIPAIAVTMYDGYYIYAPTYVPVTVEDENGVQLFYDIESGNKNKVSQDSEKGMILYEAKGGGETYYYEYLDDAQQRQTQTLPNLTTDINKAKMEYRHTLNNKIAYSARYKDDNRTDIVVNYTLDNRIYVYGEVDGTSVTKDGYLIYLKECTLPRAHLKTESERPKASDIQVDRGVKGVKTEKIGIETEILQEQVLFFESNQYILKTFKYIYDATHEKLYYDEIADNFFTINASTKERQFIKDDESIRIGSKECRYKSVSVLWGKTDGTTEYKKVYQILNGRDKRKWCISIRPENSKEKNNGIEIIDTEVKDNLLVELGLDDLRFSTIYRDFSSISYYVEAYAFTNWVNQNLANKNFKQVDIEYNNENNKYEMSLKDIPSNTFRIDENNDPENIYSIIVEHKREIMKNKVIGNLNLSISNYNRSGTYGFKLPILTEKDWEQVFSNISLITFFQGIPIGLKYYNNYAIATSTTNREYVDPGELLFSGEDTNYHRVYCEKCGNIIYTGYRSVEYVQKEFTKGENNIYYYQHDNVNNTNSEIACYYCTVNKANYKQTENEEIAYLQAKSYSEALARERYYQKESLDGKIGIMIRYHSNVDGYEEVKEIHNMPEDQEAEPGVQTTLSTKRPSIDTTDQFIKYVFVGWTTDKDSTRIDYMPGTTVLFDDDVDLYAIWRISLSNLNWKKDYTPSVSNINIRESDDGAIVEMVGNETNPGKGATWATFTSEFVEIQEFAFNYYINKGDSFNSGGFMFNVIEDGNTLSGYMLSINFAGKFYYTARSNGAIYKFRYNKNSNWNNVESIELIQPLQFGTYTGGRESSGSGNITITVVKGGYIVKGSELAQEYFVPVDDIKPDTFGFYSDHYSHNCSQIGYFKLDNIKIVVVRNK